MAVYAALVASVWWSQEIRGNVSRERHGCVSSHDERMQPFFALHVDGHEAAVRRELRGKRLVKQRWASAA